jgi:hypothetical protein
MSRHDASPKLLEQARQQLLHTQTYLRKHFAKPQNEDETIALIYLRRALLHLTQAIRERDAAQIAKYSRRLTKGTIYLWAIRTRSRGDAGE